MKNKKNLIEFLIIVYVSSILIANTIVGKTWRPFENINFEITSAFLFFIFPMVIGDILAEIVSKKYFMKIILYGFIMNLIMSLTYTFVVLLPNENQQIMDAYQIVLGQSFIVFIASMIGYLCGSLVNAFVFWTLKDRHKDERFKFRAFISTIFGQISDNALFMFIAFGIGFGMNIKEILILFISESLLEILIEFILLPITNLIVLKIKGE